MRKKKKKKKKNDLATQIGSPGGESDCRREQRTDCTRGQSNENKNAGGHCLRWDLFLQKTKGGDNAEEKNGAVEERKK
jgi:hypothetical protein